MTKMSYVSALESVLSAENKSEVMTAEVCDKLEALLESLKKKAGSSAGKETKTAREAREFAEKVYELLVENGSEMRCGEIAEKLEVSGQKVSAALTKLVKAGRVEKSLGEKKVSLFAIVKVNEN